MNYYEILGVSADATDQQIKQGYRREAMKWHPDRHEGAAAKGEADRRFKDLALAYRTLRDPTAKADYDRELDQKLRQEYTARQQEQARQEKAQQERAHAQSAEKQTREDPPKADFVNTGPQFKEETVSGDDANQMFFEQMLDLAFELAGRGFPEANIFKALIALGCPDSMARAVAGVAAKKSQPHASKSAGHSGAETEVQPENTKTSHSKDDYYKAALGERNQIYYLKKFQQFDLQGKTSFTWPKPIHFFLTFPWLCYRGMYLNAFLYLISPFILMILVFLANGTDIKNGESSYIIFQIIMFCISSIYIPARANAIYYNYINKKIIKVKLKYFDSKEQLLKLAKDGGTSFTAGTGPIIALIVVAIIGITAAVALPAYQDYTRRAQVATGFSFGSDAAQKISDYYSKKKTGPVDLGITGYALAPSESVKDVTYDSQTGLLTITLRDSFFNAKSLLLIPAVTDGRVAWLCTSKGIDRKYLPQSCRETQEDANARLATMIAETKANDKTNLDYSQVLAAIEAQHPELNPDSPGYNIDALRWVSTRTALYQERGQTPANSLQLAVADYVAEKTKQVFSQSTSTPPLNTYIAELKKLSFNDRHLQAIADMGVKFPIFTASLINVTKDFRQTYGQQAQFVEDSQTWGFMSKNGSKFGFMVLQNRSPRRLKGVVLEVQAEERSCEDKGNVYYMSLNFDTAMDPASVIGVTFPIPSEISSAKRCIDIVDLIYG